MEKTSPKLLVVNGYLNLQSGGGITLSNLLAEWPEDKLFVAANLIFPEETSKCKIYYRFGHEETKRPWPFDKIQPYYKSGEVVFNKQEDTINDADYASRETKYHPFVKSVFEKALHFFGLHYTFFPLKISDDFIEWVEKINPDIIYTQLSSVKTILFVDELLKRVKKPYVVHIMDDWPLTINRIGIENLVWKNRINRLIIKLFSNASILMSIGKGMSDAYKRRYGLDFIPFQNCIDLDFWARYKKQDWSRGNTFKILYAGRIGIGTSNSVLKIAKAVEKLVLEGANIEFQVQCKSIPSKFIKQFKRLKYTQLNEFLPYEELPKKLASVDLLVLPMDFDRKNLNYIRLSMPTKVPEYFASGTPILVFADETTALVKYAQADNWGEVVTENSIDALAKAIKSISADENKRRILSQNATALIAKNHSKVVVRDEFKRLLNEVMKRS